MTNCAPVREGSSGDKGWRPVLHSAYLRRFDSLIVMVPSLTGAGIHIGEGEDTTKAGTRDARVESKSPVTSRRFRVISSGDKHLVKGSSSVRLINK